MGEIPNGRPFLGDFGFRWLKGAMQPRRLIPANTHRNHCFILSQHIGDIIDVVRCSRTGDGDQIAVESYRYQNRMNPIHHMIHDNGF